MKEIVVVGAGKIGATIADLLASTGEYAVTVVDRSQAQLDALESGVEVKTQALDIEDAKALEAALTGKFAVLSAAPFHLTTRIAEAAAKAGVHYLDLTEDVASTRRVKSWRRKPKRLSFRSVALLQASSPSLPMIWRSVSISSTAFVCASALYHSILRTL